MRNLCQPREMGIFLARNQEREHGKTSLISEIQAWVLLLLGFTPGNPGICSWGCCRYPAGPSLDSRGSSAHPGEPEPIHPGVCGNPSPPNCSLSSSSDFSGRARWRKDGSRRALTGSSQLSSKKLQFCKQRSVGEGPGPHVGSPMLVTTPLIHHFTCRSREKSMSVSSSSGERKGSAEGWGWREAASPPAPGSHSLTGARQRTERSHLQCN